ncbi:HAMP domain-containing sensor histidine kinase [Mucilaginibacter sp. CSA2-8R]|uniref:sensor histidine kinase n=1 Tax=Mucilaginibacter sp. CSA2-8R TaxID=3141542 RepID=UPI00315C7D16
MKLLHRYNRSTILLTVTIMLFAAVVYYFAIKLVLSRQIDKSLRVEEREVLDYVRINAKLPQIFYTNHQTTSFALVKSLVPRRFIDTVYMDLKDDELEPARAIYTSVKVGLQLYQVTVVQSMVETQDLIKVIFLITLGLIIVLLTALFIFNRIILSNIWKPFYTILDQLRSFTLSSGGPIPPVNSSIDEFKELNKAVIVMAARARDDYQALKAFTENASHELMTPISVVNSKLDTFVQTGAFSDEQSLLLSDIYNSVAKLTRLNRSMLLLAKIENGLITDKQPVKLDKVVRDTLNQYEDVITGLDIRVNVDLKPKTLDASLLLIEVLISNLMGNAIKHNVHGGIISIELNEHHIRFTNSGKDIGALDVRTLFDRFKKSASSDGTGLGLTISKEICDHYRFTLSYRYANRCHEFTVTFTSTN